MRDLGRIVFHQCSFEESQLENYGVKRRFLVIPRGFVGIDRSGALRWRVSAPIGWVHRPRQLQDLFNRR
jgi:hypothetical protein